MAQVAKAVAATAVASVGSARFAAPPSGVSNIFQPTVEGASGGAGLSAGTAQFTYRDERGGTGFSFQQEDRSTPQRWSLLVAPSQTFAAIMEARNVANDDLGGARGGGMGHFAGLIGRAVVTYETNARIIHGTGESPLGANVSMRL